MLALALQVVLAAQAPQVPEPLPGPAPGRAPQQGVTHQERAERLKDLRGAWRVSPTELAARRSALLSQVPRAGVPVVDEDLHDQLSDLQQRERVLRTNPAIVAWQRGAPLALKSLDFEQTLTLYAVLLLDHELDIVELMDCWTVETRTGVLDICDADGLFSHTVEELPLKQRRLILSVERRLRDAHLERLAADVETAGYDCDETCAESEAAERKECLTFCRSDQRDAREMARDELDDAKRDLAGPVDRITLLTMVMDYGMVFD